MKDQSGPRIVVTVLMPSNTIQAVGYVLLSTLDQRTGMWDEIIEQSHYCHMFSRFTVVC